MHSARRGVGSAGYELALAKEDFKFSVAHFAIFGADRAERLHGHNYTVQVRVSGDSTDELGLLLNLEELKKQIRAICASLDGKTLVPRDCSLLRVKSDDRRVEVTFNERCYRLPIEDTLLLPIVNTSIEELALYIWCKLAPGLQASRATDLSVEVEETPGQSCVYHAGLRKC